MKYALLALAAASIAAPALASDFGDVQVPEIDAAAGVAAVAALGATVAMLRERFKR
ncbi:hypothetical protein [Mangrovicoccus sp. HB161399]|uniref:hypothetical protein n=1 Tax=Mangrovicoccus sp. HB161399 TaxID=2720392 RepID=UPI00155349DE|nr:hypothetical protein [Mangrovicoccus sp. HB161399]